MVSGQVNLIINTRENYFVLPCLLIGSEQYDVRSEIKVILGEGRYCTLIECKPPVVWANLSITNVKCTFISLPFLAMLLYHLKRNCLQTI